MKFVIHQYAYISVAYLSEVDLDLVLRVEAPNHMAKHDTGRASFFYLPTKDKAVCEHFLTEARTFGLSERFIAIMLELSRQGIPYVRFDQDGGAVGGLDPRYGRRLRLAR